MSGGEDARMIQIEASGGLAAALKAKFNKEETTDLLIKLQCSDGARDVYCMKAIVTARSTVLDELVKKEEKPPAQGKKHGSVVLKEEASILSMVALLEYLHADSCEFTNLAEMLALSQKHKVVDLATRCCEATLSQGKVSLQNLWSTFHAARLAQNRPLLEACFACYHESDFVEVTTSSDLTNLSRDELEFVIKNDGFGKGTQGAQELAVYRAVCAWAERQVQLKLGKDKATVLKESGLLKHVRFALMPPSVLSDDIKPSGMVPMEILFEAYEVQALKINKAKENKEKDSSEAANRKALRNNVDEGLILAKDVLSTPANARKRDGRFREHFVVDFLVEEYEKEKQEYWATHKDEGKSDDGENVCKLDMDYFPCAEILKLDPKNLLALLPGRPNGNLKEMRLPLRITWMEDKQVSPVAMKKAGLTAPPWPMDYCPSISMPRLIHVNLHPTGQLCTHCLNKMEPKAIEVDEAKGVLFFSMSEQESSAASKKKMTFGRLLLWVQAFLHPHGRHNFVNPDQEDGYDLAVGNKDRYTELLTEQLQTYNDFKFGMEMPQMPIPTEADKALLALRQAKRRKTQTTA